MRHRAFPGSGPEVRAQYQRAFNWILSTIYENEKATEWCKQHGVPLTKQARTSVDSQGGFLVQADLSDAILDIRDRYGAFRRRARIVPMARDNMAIPRRIGGTVAYFASATSSSINVDQVQLVAKKLFALVNVSSELEDDALVDIVDFVANEIGVAFAAAEDDSAFNGDGTSAYGSMRGLASYIFDGQHNKAKYTAASGHNTYNLLDSTDLSGLMGSVRASAMPNAAWFCSAVCFANTFCRLATTSGILDTRTVDGISTQFFLGFPVILTQKMPQITSALTGKMMLAFGDMYAAGLLGQRSGLTMARSEDRYLDQDQIGIRGTERVHTVMHDVGDNTNFGSIAALVAP